MKRFVSLFLAVLLTLSMLAGCGGEKTPETTAPVSAPETTAPAEVPETTEPAAPETTAPAAGEERPLALGVVEGSTYTNTYAGFGCTFGDGWSIMPADQLQELPALVQDAVEGTAVGEAMQDVQQFTDVLAENMDTLTSINVLFQKLGMQERLAYMLLSEEDILDATLEQKDAMIEAYAAVGMEVSSMEKATVTFLGEERFALKTVSETQGVPCYTLQVFDYSLGEYSVTLTVTSYIEDNTESMLELFYAVE